MPRPTNNHKPKTNGSGKTFTTQQSLNHEICDRCLH